MTQCESLLAAFRRGEALTTLEAMRMPSPICRLSERIRELERAGYIFDKVRVRVGGRAYTRYSLRFELAA